jgi:peptidoglycan/LPS O-acetylase OafA/YrhL
MPKPIEAGARYVPGLDGIRALAVLFVIAYHLSVPHAGGGMLGVGVFFTLSGYLITDLLLSHWRRHGSLGLGQFWIRRARRLLPALFLMLAAVSVWVALFDSSQLSGVRRQVWAAVLYVSNWSTIEQNGSYFAKFAPPLPLDHLWSLAIEEQFYLIWPLLLLVGIWFLRSRRRMALVTLVLAGASALAMALVYHRGYDPTRAYEGTDTRAFGLLIGCALAMVWPMRPRPGGPRPGASRVLDLVGVAGLVGIAGLVAGTSTLSPFLYPYGFLLLSFATAALLVSVVNPAGTVGAVLGWTPLRWIGVRSYGIYLWHWPIVVLLLPQHNTFDAGWAALAVAVTFAVSALSWRYVEEPIRRGALGRLWRGTRAGAGRVATRRHALALSSFAAAALLVSALGLSGMLPAASAGERVSTSNRVKHVRALSSGHPEKASVRVRKGLPTRTSCASVVYIGDSTSAGEIETDYVPNRRQRLPAQLAKIGVKHPYIEIQGARSIVETFEGYPNAPTVAENRISSGYDGCWIVAMGTQDVDNAYDGGIGYSARITRMMKALHGQPVMWVSAVSLLRAGDTYLSRGYNEANMQKWNRTLLGFCKRYPNMRVFDWGAWARTKWFDSDGHFEYDGIHYNTVGNIAKARLTSQALAHAFPAGSPPSRTCVVR